MNCIKHLFLDLEDTIITPVMNGWANTNLINLDKIKTIQASFNPDFVNVFSFAIHNEFELSRFNDLCRPMIENALGTKLNLVPTVDKHIIPWCCNVMKMSPDVVDFSEASAFWGKHEAFRLTCRHLFKNNWTSWAQTTEVVLLDDAVIDETFEWAKMQIKGSIINIDTL